MIDLHTHLLPGLDDGADSLDTAEAMARAAVADGITTVIATPHSGPSDDRIDTGQIHTALIALREHLESARIPLRIYPGEEVAISMGLAEELESGKILPLGEGKWVLVECPFNHIPFFTDGALFDLQTAGYRAVIAHPERNFAIQQDWNIAARYADTGSALQIDTLSLLGLFGEASRKTAERLLMAGAVHVIGSDGHSVEKRPLLLSAARKCASRFVGEDGAQLLVEGNPKAILEGKPVQPVSGRNIPESGGFFSSLKHRLFPSTG